MTERERERLIELLEQAKEKATDTIGSLNNGFGAWYADYLLANGAIAPPVSVGDVVYALPPCWSKEDSVSAYQITNFIISHNKKGVWTKKYRAMWFVNGKTVDAQINFWFDDIGRTVFLTREEAEKALERSRG